MTRFGGNGKALAFQFLVGYNFGWLFGVAAMFAISL